MFRRKRSASNPPPRLGTHGTTPAAQLAASQAFLAQKASDANLSASAAAAALRSSTSTPMPVGDLQTKRMQRRSSITSNSSMPAQGRGLQRRDSSGSMSERSFRSPSPNHSINRPSSSHGPYPNHDSRNAPPVPNLPARYASPASAGRVSAVQRPASAQSFTAASGPSSKDRMRQARNIDRSASVNSRQGNPGTRLSSLSTIGEADQAAKRASVNFSRPISPTNSPTLNGLTSNARPMSPTLSRPQNADQTAARPRMKKKKNNKEPAPALDPDYVKEGEAGSAPTSPHQEALNALEGRVLAPSDSAPDALPATETSSGAKKPKKTKKKLTAGEADRSTASEPTSSSRVESTVADDFKAPSPSKQTPRSPTRPAGLLVKQPSMVREDPEAEAEAEGHPASIKAKKKRASLNGKPLGIQTTNPQSDSGSATMDKKQDGKAKSNARKSKVKTLAQVPPDRPGSISPARAARFSAQLSFDTPDAIRHQPPPRSISPAKSVLKNSPSYRNSAAYNAAQGSRTSSKAPSFILPDTTTKAGPSKADLDNLTQVLGTAAKQEPESTGMENDASKIVHGDDRQAEGLETDLRGKSGELDDSRSPQPHVNDVQQVPDIAILPATPGIDGNAVIDRDPFGSEGAGTSQITDGQDTSSTHDHTHPSSSADTTALPSSPATSGIAEPEPEAAAARHSPAVPNVGEVAESLRSQIESQSGEDSEDHVSLYSDAAEDQSEIDGDGFGSINAIVESPTSPTRHPSATKSNHSPSPPTEKSLSAEPEPPPQQSWSEAQEYWSSLSKTRKRQIEEAAVPGSAGTINQSTEAARTLRGKISIANQRDVRSQRSTVSQSPRRAGRAGPAANSAREHAVHQESDGTRRKDAKRGQDHSKRLSYQDPSARPRESLSTRARPSSAVAYVEPGRRNATDQKDDNSTANAKKTDHAMKKKLTRTKSDGSDSSSSFRRERRAPPNNGKYTMKRSMREAGGGSANRMTSNVGNGASSSLAMKSQNTGTTSRGTMRLSMREGQTATQTQRSSLRSASRSSTQDRAKSPSRFGFHLRSRSQSIEPMMHKSDRAGASRNASRFQDSSDEEPDLPTQHNSRFADSSDEEDNVENKSGAASRIPESIAEQDVDSRENGLGLSIREDGRFPISTSSAADQQKSARPVRGSEDNPASQSSPWTKPLSTVPDSAAVSKKTRSFLSSFPNMRRSERSRVRESDAQKPVVSNLPQNADRPAAKAPETPRSLAAERRTDQTKTNQVHPHTLANNPKSASERSLPRRGKLQRRTTPKGQVPVIDPSWPVPRIPTSALPSPSSPMIGGASPVLERPRTSDGAPITSKHSTAPQSSATRTHGRSSSITVMSPDDAALGNGKKRRFPMLRKAFGLQN